MLIAFENTISLFAHILILSAHALIAFENLLGLSARILILSAHALIVFENRISLSARTLIASTLPCDIACSPTVPGGDTPCLTAGDARRVNPWIDEELPHLRHRRCRTAAASARTRLSLYAFSATPPASEVGTVHFSTGSPSLCSGFTRGYAWCASAGGGSVWMREQRWESESGVESICKTIYGMRRRW